MNFETIGMASFIAIGVMIVLGIVIPLLIGIIWCMKTKERFVKVIAGAIVFLVFAIVLESIPKTLLLSPLFPIGNLILSTPLLFVLIGGLLAGLFEEVGRWVGYKILVRKDLNNKKTAISFGIGHGGFEIAYIFVIGGFQYLVYAFMINNGTFGQLIEQLPSQANTFITLAKTLHEMTILSLIPSLIERCSALMIHLSCSILVYKAIQQKRIYLPLSILVHSGFDWIAGAYQVGWISNVFVVEVLLFVFASLLFYCCIKLYKSIP